MAESKFLLCCVVLIFSLITASVDGQVADKAPSLDLVYSKVLDNEGKYHLWWNFDDDVIVMKMRVQTTGYIGLGFSPNGGMVGSDILIVGVDDATNVPYISDRFANSTGMPYEDYVQDWKMMDAQQNDTHTVVRVWRKLDTCNRQDWTIKAETIRVIWAYHPMDWVASPYLYHGSNRGAKSIFLLNPQKVVPTIPEDSVTVEFLNPQIKVPSNDTTYWCEAFNMPHFDRKHHIIKFEPVVQPGNEGVVHHMVLMTCPETIDNSTAGQGRACFSAPEWLGCVASIYGWAVGGEAFYLPGHVGFPVGLSDDPKLIILQTHYDNPTGRSDIVDSSGIRMTLTPRLRQHDAGMLLTGVLTHRNMFIPPYADKYRVDGHCFAECLEEGMGNQTSINVFAAFLHAHLLSVAIRLRHFRNGVEQRPISVDEHYDFNLQETRLLSSESEIMAGDNLVTECDYVSTHKSNMTFGAEGTTDEMCVTFVMYYPRVPISSCYSMQPVVRLAQIAGVTLAPGINNYTVESPPEKQGRNVLDVLANDVDWKDRKNRARAQEETTSYNNPITALCFKDFQHMYFQPKGYWVRPRAIREKWLERRMCSSARRRSPRHVIAAVLISAYFYRI